MSDEELNYAIVFHELGEKIWDFLDIQDVVQLSTCSRLAAGFEIKATTLNKMLAREPQVGTLGQMKLSLATGLSTGMVRRVMNRLKGSTEVIVGIDDRSGRVIVDIGSAFHDKDAFLAPAHTFAEEEPESPDHRDHSQIFKQLEISSYDEYDDFNPRHPMPKDRAHRRGDSYFNSDIESVVGELGPMSMGSGGGLDLSNIAKAALQDNSKDSSPVPSAKSRILGRAKGRPPMPNRAPTIAEEPTD